LAIAVKNIDPCIDMDVFICRNKSRLCGQRLLQHKNISTEGACL